MDWTEIKTEYITKQTSYRKLAEKYGVSQSSLRKVAAREQWVTLRNNFGTSRDAEMANTLGAEAGKKEAVIDTKYYALIAKLLEKAEFVIDNTPVWQASTIKEMASAMKYLKECRGIKSEIDMREQEARIRNLERQQQEEQTDPCGVILLPSIVSPPEAEEE